MGKLSINVIYKCCLLVVCMPGPYFFFHDFPPLSYFLDVTNFILDASFPYSCMCVCMCGGCLDTLHWLLQSSPFLCSLKHLETPHPLSPQIKNTGNGETEHSTVSVPFTEIKASLWLTYYTPPSVPVLVFSLSLLGSWDDAILQWFLFCCCDQTPSPTSGMIAQHLRVLGALIEDLGSICSI